MDEETAALIVQLQLNDIETLHQSSKGKGQEGTHSDAEASLAAYKEDLLKTHFLLHDRLLAISITKAVATDAALLQQLKGEEQAVSRDRDLALRLAGVSQRSEKPKSEENGSVDQLMEQFSCLNVAGHLSYFQDAQESNTPSSSKDAEKQVGNIVFKVICVACQEEKHSFDILEAPCGHSYCRACINGLFQGALIDESLFPPRCCRQVILLSSRTEFFDEKFIKLFDAKSIEYSTPNRTYCRGCETFMEPRYITQDVGICPSCQLRTCVLCKAIAHEDGECPMDSAYQSVLSLASEKRWKICYSCKKMVERIEGCNHIM